MSSQDHDFQRAYYDRHFATRGPVLREQLDHPLFADFNRRLAERLLAHAPATADPVRVVELGCGEGLLAAAFVRADRAVDYVGSDLSAAALALAADAVPGARFAVLDAGASAADAAPTGWADLVVAKNLLHHVDEPAALLAGARELLGPGGRVAVVEPTRSSAQAMLFSVLAPKREKHFFRRGRRAIRRSIVDAGLRLVAHEPYGFLPYELAFALRFSSPRRVLHPGPAGVRAVARVDELLERTLPWVASYQVFVAEAV